MKEGMNERSGGPFGLFFAVISVNTFLQLLQVHLKQMLKSILGYQ